MSKKILLVVAAFAAVAGLTGCTSINTNDGAVPAKIGVASKNVTPEYVIGPKKVYGTASVNSLFGFINWGVTEFADDAFVTTSMPICVASGNTVAKQGATYQACKSAKADCILGAKYKLDTKDYFVFKQIKCTVTGFPAQLKTVK